MHNIFLLTNFIEVERKFSGNWAIQSSLKISDPILSQYISSASVLFTDSRNSAVHTFSTVDILYSRFPEEEKNEVSDIEGSYEIGLWKKMKIILVNFENILLFWYTDAVSF